jgi:uncharacterized repeat protein (TIGR01451 family)
MKNRSVNGSNKFKAAALAAAAVIALACVWTAAAAPAQQQQPGASPVKIDLVGEVRRGDKDVPVGSVSVRPGDIITWRMTVSNQGGARVHGIRADGLVPSGTRFESGSAQGGSAVRYSVDGGRTYSPRPTVRVTGPDGVTREVDAPADSYTNVLFVWESYLSPGEVQTATYRTVVR